MTTAYSRHAVTDVEALQVELAHYRSGIKAITVVTVQSPKALGKLRPVSAILGDGPELWIIIVNRCSDVHACEYGQVIRTLADALEHRNRVVRIRSTSMTPSSTGSRTPSSARARTPRLVAHRPLMPKSIGGAQRCNQYRQCRPPGEDARLPCPLGR